MTDPDSTSRVIIDRELAELDEHKTRFAERAAAWRAEHTGRKLVLLAEDDDDLASGLATFLGRHGFTVTTASSGSAALELARSVSIDVAIVDLNLPDVTGMRVVERLRRDSLRPLAPIICITGAVPNEEARRLARDAGASDLLHKPFDLGELLNLIRRLLG